ncbi:MAG TPA: carbohydrate porin [Rhodopila sp.]|nr:carbohydrate porin [Rhodopila sp.]
MVDFPNFFSARLEHAGRPSANRPNALLAAICAAVLATAAPRAAAAATPDPAADQPPAPPGQQAAPPAQAPTNDSGEQLWAIHGQATYTQMFQPAFRSPYQGSYSLPSAANGRETFDATLFVGVRPWKGAEIWFNPEADQGYGLGDSYGVAGYLSGEAYKVGETDPYYRMPRAFFRQTIDLGGETQKIDPDLNQLGGSQTANRVVFTIGKFSVTDIFDANKYAHDPRNDFLNWSVIDAGTYDYAADAWGSTYGAAVEWYQDWWTIRAGLFDMSAVPNGIALSLPLFHQDQFNVELEERHTLFGQPGKLKFLYYLSRGNMGTYADALALADATHTTPSTLAVANYRSKYGVVLNLEQQLAPDLGLFARLGWTQGGVEAYDFTDIDQTIQLGLSLTGTRWGRPDDTVGLAGVANQISNAEKTYLAAGGLGAIIGDGQLSEAGPEQILETFYSYAATSYARITTDFQIVNNPAYNRQRGPVEAISLRLHVEY